jgi:putative methionine-R-sulfoxide reductase with GAF domain
MKSKGKISHLAIVSLLFLGTLFSGLVLFNLTANIEQASGRIDLSAINEASSVFNMVYLVVGSTLILGLISSIRLLYQVSSQKGEVIISSTDREKATETITNRATVFKKDLDKTVDEIKAQAKNIKDPKEKYEKLLARLCMELEASQGLLYEVKKVKSKQLIELMSSFAFNHPESETIKYEFGEGLVGQVAKEGKKVIIDDIPEGYITIISGLGAASPNHLAIIPIMEGKEVAKVVEIASFREISASDENLIAKVLQVEGKQKPTKSVSVRNKVEEKVSN